MSTTEKRKAPETPAEQPSYSKKLRERKSDTKNVPTTILTGFLGSGKTTLLNYILREQHGLKIAVIENEFGEIGIDDKLVSKRVDSVGDEEIFEMNNGCICCKVRGDLVRILTNLVEKKDKFDLLLIETTGLADPAPVVQTFFVDDTVQQHFSLDGIVTVCDAKHLLQHLDEVKADGSVNEAQQQVAFADRVLLNKIDLVTPEEADIVEKRILEVNKSAKVMRTEHSKVDLHNILAVNAFSLQRCLDLDADFLKTEDHSSDDESCHSGHEGDHSHKHSHSHCTDHDCHDSSHAHKESCHDHDCHDPAHHHKKKKEHKHDNAVRSVGIVFPGHMNYDKLQMWVAVLRSTLSQDIFRMKGVLSIAGDDSPFVFQAVHMLWNGSQLEAWGPNDVRENKMVFIGRNLDREELTRGFRACLDDGTPPLTDEQVEESDVLMEEAVHNSIEGELDSAISLYDKVIAMSPRHVNSIRPLLGRADCLISRALDTPSTSATHPDLVAALADIDAALAIFPFSQSAFLVRATVHTHMGNNPKALEDYKLALKYGPDTDGDIKADMEALSSSSTS